MLNFSLDKLPPSSEEIEAERALLLIMVKNRRRISFLAYCGTVVVALTVGISIAPAVPAAAFAVACGLTISIVGPFATDNLTRLTRQLALLSFIDNVEHLHRCTAILEACQQDADCEAYRLAVAKQGRSLTVGEANIITRWVEEVEVKKRKEEKQSQVACTMLRSTETV